ncbi:MAG: hypothetical protein FWD71_10555 [Oscillospiraceae bacterium]|nr:hypothetical protein [Oscillospiraceae bacterium]
MSLHQDLSNIFDLYKEKNGILKECLDISLEIKNETENETDELADKITVLTDMRENCIERMKNTDLAISHYSSKLPAEEQEIIKEAKRTSEAGITVSGLFNSAEKAIMSELCDLSALSETDYMRRLYNILEDNKSVLNKIKVIDENNTEIIKYIMDQTKNKFESIRGNRNLMNKFVGDKISYLPGTLMNEKK